MINGAKDRIARGPINRSRFAGSRTRRKSSATPRTFAAGSMARIRPTAHTALRLAANGTAEAFRDHGEAGQQPDAQQGPQARFGDHQGQCAARFVGLLLAAERDPPAGGA